MLDGLPLSSGIKPKYFHIVDLVFALSTSELSLEFCSGKICSGGTKFSLKILVPGTKFSENFVPSLKKLFHN